MDKMNQSMLSERNAEAVGPFQPNPALKRLDRLVGTWIIRGRTLDSDHDNIRGQVTIEWMPGGLYLQQRGEMEFMDFRVYSLEIVGYDASTGAFSSFVFSNMDETPARYYWDVQGDTVTHWTKGSKYTGTFNEAGTMLTGGWRPDEGEESSPDSTYDATMMRIK